VSDPGANHADRDNSHATGASPGVAWRCAAQQCGQVMRICVGGRKNGCAPAVMQCVARSSVRGILLFLASRTPDETRARLAGHEVMAAATATLYDERCRGTIRQPLSDRQVALQLVDKTKLFLP
jgi:hypothetical protein